MILRCLLSSRAVNRSDLRKHIPTHTRKRKRIKNENVDDDLSDEENSEAEAKDPKPKKKYACHMCPEKHTKVSFMLFSMPTLTPIPI